MRPYDAVVFDLLTGLLDSWSLWNSVAGDDETGLAWRRAYLRLTYATGPYQSYEEQVATAAAQVGLKPSLARRLSARYAELEPWPGVREMLTQLSEAGVPMGIATNCSERLGQIAAARVGIPFRTVVTAERAGFYKPHPAPYRLALAELRVQPHRCLFVAGSPYDLTGATRLGLAVWWHDRLGTERPDGAPRPLVHARDLHGLPDFLLES